MKEHPTLFRGEMVRALLNTKVGSWPAEPINPDLPFKWQTRRPVKDQIVHRLINGNDGLYYDADCIHPGREIPCKWRKGDVLWVKETFGVHKGCPARKISNIGPGWICYQADGGGMCPPSLIKRWRPSIFMPRRFHRIALELMEDPEPQRVNEISEQDAKAEGVLYPTQPFSGDPYRLSFRLLWDSIHGKYPSSFLSAPWVWKLSFKRIK
ncbi:hypothetical protein KGP36_02775 [Patescibacteria group bacterium]|nr:hypothetical protein [Patescibacteria group bacterium]